MAPTVAFVTGVWTLMTMRCANKVWQENCNLRGTCNHLLSFLFKFQSIQSHWTLRTVDFSTPPCLRKLVFSLIFLSLLWPWPWPSWSSAIIDHIDLMALDALAIKLHLLCLFINGTPFVYFFLMLAFQPLSSLIIIDHTISSFFLL